MNKSLIKIILYILIVVFVLLMSTIVIQSFRSFMGLPSVLVFGTAFSLVGFILLYLTLKEKAEGELKKYLMLTGVCSGMFFISVLLHNIFYAVGTVVSHIAPLSYLMEFLHVAFFFVAIPISPLGFLVGVVGAMRILLKSREEENI